MELIEKAAVGRPFSLGMFYDCRSDKLVPGITLWDKEKLDRDKSVTPKPNTEFRIVASESISDKSSSLGVDASLKASFLSGLVSVEGSAKYLNDNKKSIKQARVTLQYKTTTVLKELTTDQLGTGNIKHCEVIEKATHVVTGILYGAQAFFMFDQETSEGENVRDIEGNLKMMIKKIPSLAVGGDGALRMEDKDTEKVNKFSCSFHGDFLLEKSPTTFEEAVRVYQDLPRLLGPNKENVVPVTVHLLPLSTLDSRASKLVRQISLRLVTEAENVLEGFIELESQCNDVLDSPACRNFTPLSQKIKTFKALCSEFMLGLQRTLSQKIPLIRGGGEEEAALAEVLKKASESPFNSHRLKQWIDEKHKEANTVKTLMKLMKNSKTVSSENALSDKVCDSKNALVFVLTSLDSTEPFLSELDQYLKGSQSNSSEAPEPRHWYRSEVLIDSVKRLRQYLKGSNDAPEPRRWYSEDMIDSVRHKATLFSDFAEANKDSDKQSLQFLVVCLTDKNQEGSAIYLYKDGDRVSENFEPPSKPGAVTVSEVTHNTVRLHFRAPSEGARSVTEYRVEFREKGQEEWNQQLQPEAGEVTVTGLSPNTEYSVRVRAITSVGVGPAAPQTSIRTSPCGPPEELRGTASSTEIRVHWKRPQVTQGINIHHYNVEYRQTQEKIPWKREHSQSEETVIRGLQPETTYSIRILCDCGEHGNSHETSTLTITTTAKESPKADSNVGKDQDKTPVMELLSRLHLQDKYKNKLTSAEFLQIKPTELKHEQGLSESDLCSVYLHKLLMLDYRARYIQAKRANTNVTNVYKYTETDDLFATVESLSNISEQTNIHPLDLQMAVFHCSDSFLKQKMVTKLSQCQYALPLLVPDPFTGDIKCPLWTFRQIKKTWKKTETKGNETAVTMKSMSVCKAETLMVLCFRLGSLSGSKSQLINTLINDRHSTFFHRNCTGSSKNRLLLDGVAEIAWYCPSGKPTDSFTDCVAFCNLHGDGLTHHKQLQILMDKASVYVVFVQTLDRDHESAAMIKHLFESPKPLIALIESRGNSLIQLRPGKYTVGLNDRGQSDVSEELKSIIREIISAPHESFQLESMSDTGFRVDEHDASCKKGFSSAETIMKIIKSVSVSEDKQDFLSCQSQLWHDWSRINKELHHLKGNVEEERSKKLNACQKLREDQCTAYCGELMMYFVEKLSSLEQTEREYFIKWTQILLDDHTMNRLSSILQNYNQKWSEVLNLKKQSEDKERSGDHKETPSRSNKLKSKQEELVKLSQDLQSATCGLEHIFREMAQIYEAHKSLDKPPGQRPTDWSKYPELAAELMISGHPMELMDGDAGHVPLTWISGLIDQVVKKLGNKKVFVLSVLGIQSSGKSTMLNAMFGLQFAVSAGRCTRGAFMQLVKLSEDMKKDFKWDFILVVDTEGLRALELDGNQTIHHDNELATFVVGLGNMTLVNIFGENPSDMQDVLQIVVQAFMRMKKVRLSPSCVFVHQNVSDVSATEKNMNGKRKLLEKLDKMVQLAAKEEVCDAESFSDIIEFDVQKDVKYFAQLWEGSPPMAPPNPGYSECVQDLKSFILEKAKKSPDVTLSDFKTKVEDLWNALLNENFVFSFKNTLEIAVYRKLEVQYGNWTWALRSEMLKIEEQFYIRISNGELDHVNLSHLHGEVTKKYEETKLLMSEYFESEEDKDMLIQWRAKNELKIKDFLDELVRGLQKKLNNVIEQKKASKEAEEKKTEFENNLLQKSKKLALELKDNSRDDQELKSQFNHVWESWVSDLTRGIKAAEEINLEEDQTLVIHEHGFEMDLMIFRKNSQQYKTIAECGDYTEYVAKKQYESHNIVINTIVNAKKKISQFLTGRLSHEHQEQVKNLIKDVEKQALELIKQKPVVERGYSSSYLREMSFTVVKSIAEFESQWKYLMLKEFKVDLILYVFYRTQGWILNSHSQFIKNNDVRTYLESKKDGYYSVFRSFCRGSSSAVVLAEVICEKLKSSMTEVVCNQTAIDIAGDMKCNVPAFKENRLNLEKHVLKSLAERREFNRYIKYINDPKTYTETFITEEVENLLHTEYKDKCNSFFKQDISNIQQQILHALHEASETTRENNGDINMWLQEFRRSIKGELTFGTIDPQNFTDVNNFDFLGEETEKGLNSISADLSNLSADKFKNSRQRPDQILIDQLCDCCWETCPFCAAVCTNTIKDHKSAEDGGVDHSNPFHRSPSVKGWHYRGTVEMFLPFCTTEVAGDGCFHPDSSDRLVPFKQYRTAGPRYETWSITPDTYHMCYWQWVVCTFQKEIEEHYNLKYVGKGKIHADWRKVTDDQALKNLEEMYK